MRVALSPLDSNSEGLRFLELTLLFKKVRSFTVGLCYHLEVEDTQIQSMPDVSPPKWHLAHTTWFFENFILRRLVKGYQPFHPAFHYLFNSYYEGLGPHHPRSKRGLLSRPTLREIYRYRDWVDTQVLQLLSEGVSEEDEPVFREALALGLHHEQQHQELLVTDIKHILWSNPLRPAFRHWKEVPTPGRTGFGAPGAPVSDALISPGTPGPFSAGSGVHWVGFDGEDFAFDNEKPAHRIYLEPYRLARRLVKNGEYLEFIEAGGYRDSLLWLSDGWDLACREGWEAPLYWEREGGDWQVYTATGMQPVRLDEPVCHLSYYEADAFARWRGARLPTEFEWEVVAREQASGRKGLAQGNFAESGRFHPAPPSLLADGDPGDSPAQLLGDVWEWTSSSYLPYPGFRPFSGAFGEYNGKFMSGQMVLRGGSCATPRDHIRMTYRNFFGPAARWQFSGIRLAL